MHSPTVSKHNFNPRRSSNSPLRSSNKSDHSKRSLPKTRQSYPIPNNSSLSTQQLYQLCSICSNDSDVSQQVDKMKRVSLNVDQELISVTINNKGDPSPKETIKEPNKEPYKEPTKDAYSRADQAEINEEDLK